MSKRRAPNPTATTSSSPESVPAELDGRVLPLALGPEDAAASLGMPLTGFRDLVRQGRISIVQFGGGGERLRYVVPVEELQAFLRRNGTTWSKARERARHALGEADK